MNVQELKSFLSREPQLLKSEKWSINVLERSYGAGDALRTAFRKDLNVERISLLGLGDFQLRSGNSPFTSRERRTRYAKENDVRLPQCTRNWKIAHFASQVPYSRCLFFGLNQRGQHIYCHRFLEVVARTARSPTDPENIAEKFLRPNLGMCY